MSTAIRSLALAVVLAGITGGAARAATPNFPSDGAWVPLPCRGSVMIDRFQDEAGALQERDIVGDPAAPAGFHAADVDFLYLRIRLDADPAPGGVLRPFGWGIELDVDGNTMTYEALIMVAGGSGQITLSRNTTTTSLNDPNDPADTPPVASYPFATNGRSVVAPASSYGGNADFFIEVAVPWADLEAIGITPVTRVTAWAASSSTFNSLNGDFACHDGATGAPTLSGTAPDPTVLDPALDTDGDGYPDAVEVIAGTNPNDPNSHPSGPVAYGTVYEGGGGCAVGRIGAPAAGLLVLSVLGLGAGLAWRRRRRRS